mmetsp:Transcript_17383/g.48019  ORF Transcript_17383/g.48019 Transcript_17383/m.48019 type:complete len:238 (-) Transcript_17383:125-838(-)
MDVQAVRRQDRLPGLTGDAGIQFGCVREELGPQLSQLRATGPQLLGKSAHGHLWRRPAGLLQCADRLFGNCRELRISNVWCTIQHRLLCFAIDLHRRHHLRHDAGHCLHALGHVLHQKWRQGRGVANGRHVLQAAGLARWVVLDAVLGHYRHELFACQEPQSALLHPLVLRDFRRRCFHELAPQAVTRCLARAGCKLHSHCCKHHKTSRCCNGHEPNAAAPCKARGGQRITASRLSV